MTYETIKGLATLSETTITVKQLNLISWNGGSVKLDLRSWTKDGKPLKGCTLDDSEARKLVEAINRYFAMEVSGKNYLH